MDILIQLAYVVAAALFIFGLKQLGSPATARRGNMISSSGMLLAIVAALLDQGILDYQWIVIGMVIGGGIGAAAARMVEHPYSPSPPTHTLPSPTHTHVLPHTYKHPP